MLFSPIDNIVFNDGSDDKGNVFGTPNRTNIKVRPRIRKIVKAEGKENDVGCGKVTVSLVEVDSDGKLGKRKGKGVRTSLV